MAKLAAKTYGDALFELALEGNRLEELAGELDMLKTVFCENEKLAELMNHPKIDKEEKRQIMSAILKDSVSSEIDGLMQVIIIKDRYAEWENIFNYFIDRVREYKNIGTAYVTTATELQDFQKKHVEEKLLKTTRYETIDVVYSVDPSVIGGMIVRIGDRVVDSSIRTKLYELTKDLTKIRLAV